MSEKCKECGCICKRCNKNEKYGKRNSDIHLHAEIENLRQNIIEKNNHIAKMETQCLNDADKFPNGELASIKEELRICQDKFTRLFDAHKRIQKINQNLEDKLLKIVDKCETEKGAFTKDIATLSHRLADANYTIHRLSQDNSKYRNDVNLAIQLLQCKPSNFVGHKYDTLPSEVQAKVKTYISQKRRSSDMSPVDVKSITVPISTFPPTAMVYNISKPNVEKHSDDESDDNKPPVDIVSAAIMAKVLEDRERERISAKHCNTCVCHKTILMVDSQCQTITTTSGGGEEAGGETTTETTYNKDDNNFNKLPTNQINGYTPIRQPATIPQGIKLQNQSQKLNTIKQKIKLNKSLNDSRAPLLSRNSDYSSNINHEINDNPVDIINDRLWKNSWINKNKKVGSNTSKRNDELNYNNTDNDIHSDVINNRIWKNDNTDNNDVNKNNNLTLIEVKNIVDGQLQETATSPSFSSDSIVISSSEPSSISSDLLHNIKINDKKNKSAFNINNNFQQRANRELLKKNILLDNARSSNNCNYNAVVYTSSGSMSESPSVNNCTNKSTTALVHTANNNNNNNISKSTRSLSISSDEAFPILPHDATQLQRVAEWVQSSVNTSSSTTNSSSTGTKIKSTSFKKNDNELLKTKLSCTLIEMPSDVPRQNDFPSNSCFTSIKIEDEKSSMYGGKVINPSVIKNKSDVKDLITFDSTNEDEDVEINMNDDDDDDDDEVKITKEMEETYLKLAASLDPVSLSLSTSCTNPDLTIEKYRKDHKKNQLQQKIHDKSGATT